MSSGPAGKAEVKLLSSLAAMAAIQALTPEIERRAGVKLVADFGPTLALLERIRSGERADLAILTADAVGELIDEKILAPGSSIELAASLVGMAVRSGAPKPNIDSVHNLKGALLGAGSIVYSKIGASGIFFADLLQRLGIAKDVESRATVIPSGLTATVVARGDAELAIQQISELMAVSGVDIVGPLPAGAQSSTLFSIGVFGASPHQGPAQAVLGVLCSPDAASVYRRTGLQPAVTAAPRR